MNNLSKLLERLEQRKDAPASPYYVPEAWNYFGFSEYETDKDRAGELVVNPAVFYSECIKKNIICRAQKEKDYLMALDINSHSAVAVSSKTVYSMMPRMLTAWEHGEKGSIRTGTFLKSLCYLPYLKQLGVDIIYLLPVFEVSDMYKKGEKASPYAIKNIYKLDTDLHDPLTGEDAGFVETEFKAFVETCHILDIRVMVDFVFRTFSRDNDLLVEHPEWLYWIELACNETFAAPSLEGEKELLLIDDDYLDILYNSPKLEEYKARFTYPPNLLDREKWDKVVQINRDTGKNILELVEEQFGITTMPGFSNVLNDPQPPWKDVTYPKFYFDNDSKVSKYLDAAAPEFLMQDGVSLNKYHGSVKNEEIWSYTEGVIPYYQLNYGVDGARIDMGHALPPDLNINIIRKVRENNKNFLLWSEELSIEKSLQAAKDGFHFISGFLYGLYKEIQEPDFNKKLLKDTLLLSKLPVAASMETPDTPRTAYIHNDKKLLEIITFINGFIPNKVLFINNGQELMEYQPMNLGLDNTEAGRFILDKNDPMYGRLAFFDNYYLKWTSPEKAWIESIIKKVNALNKDYNALISNKENFLPVLSCDGRMITVLLYFERSSGKGLMLIINRSIKDRQKILLKEVLPEVMGGKSVQSVIKYSNRSRAWLNIPERISLREGEILAAELQLS